VRDHVALSVVGTDDKRIRLSNARFQSIAADDVAKAVADAAFGSPVNGMIGIAGPPKLVLRCPGNAPGPLEND
jgi:hypothetical protein